MTTARKVFLFFDEIRERIFLRSLTQAIFFLFRFGDKDKKRKENFVKYLESVFMDVNLLFVLSEKQLYKMLRVCRNKINSFFSLLQYFVLS